MLMQIAGLEVDVVFKPIRNIRLRVCAPDGQVKLSIPGQVSLDEAKAFVLENRDWIIQYREVIRVRQTRLTPRTPLYAERESRHVWGKQYLINVITTNHSPAVELRNGWLRLHVPAGFTAEERKHLVQTWEHNLMLEAIPPLISHWEPIMGVRVAQFSVRAMKSRWGSCSINRRTIRLNLELVSRHPDCLEYVLVHEMIHLLERGHNARFYDFMNHFLPDWHERESRLNHLPLS